MTRNRIAVTVAALTLLGGLSAARAATVLTSSDGVIRNSLCVGIDCPNSPSFSDSTLILMENNTRIKFADTSTAASFPRNDWELQANQNSNGGANRFALNDCGESSNAGGCAEDPVFVVEAGARANALYVEDDGDVGIGTSLPVVTLHLRDGNTPTLRLEQDGSSGFTPQSWDLAGNETNFFVRDATGGSTLPLRIEPGTGSNTLYLDSAEQVGIGTSSPEARLHVQSSGGNAKLLVKETSSSTTSRVLADLTNNGPARFKMENTANSIVWDFRTNNPGDFSINNPSGGSVLGAALTINHTTGDVTAATFNGVSARATKNVVRPVDPASVLTRVAALPLAEWTFKKGTGDLHLGPMAEDFHAAFGLGGSPGQISLLDASGVALAAIQGLKREIDARDGRIWELERTNAALAARLAAVEAALGLTR